jgi:superfamily II DNA or RNA helicase
MIKDLGHDKVFYVSGEIDTDTRTALKKMAENETGIVVVASYGVFSTGISIKNLHHVILAHGVKSKIIVLQTIGRVLRKHGSKDVATVWDIIDDCGVKPKSANAKKTYTHINYLLKHGLERIQRYADEKFDYVMKLVEL